MIAQYWTIGGVSFTVYNVRVRDIGYWQIRMERRLLTQEEADIALRHIHMRRREKWQNVDGGWQAEVRWIER